MQYFALLTLALGNAQASTSATVTLTPSTTRADIWRDLREHIAKSNHNDQWLNATTLFFSIEPNTFD